MNRGSGIVDEISMMITTSSSLHYIAKSEEEYNHEVLKAFLDSVSAPIPISNSPRVRVKCGEMTSRHVGESGSVRFLPHAIGTLQKLKR
jgi:hypothetical protein